MSKYYVYSVKNASGKPFVAAIKEADETIQFSFGERELVKAIVHPLVSNNVKNGDLIEAANILLDIVCSNVTDDFEVDCNEIPSLINIKYIKEGQLLCIMEDNAIHITKNSIWGDATHEIKQCISKMILNANFKNDLKVVL
ncbi:hypothetical protein C9J21_17780 [Photobacterium phosphoreum]|uniref:hypothetical protein n=1 Tax=Photobacterium phosphoreum TaxID=659 RepID=UPI000D154776|nr:hypothetical protein [Photobacterium phosphoreum]PSW31199.1 hypothetical protein C9J21_17780 [Photobacterium phosphoreum]